MIINQQIKTTIKNSLHTIQKKNVDKTKHILYLTKESKK